MWRPQLVWNPQTRSASSTERNPSPSWVGSTVRPQAPTAPVSWVLIWASGVQTTPSKSRSMPATQMRLALVPPTQNSTAASGWPQASRMRARARSVWGSPSV